MEKLRVPFVRPGESNAVNRALSESMGLLPPSDSQLGSREQIAKPIHGLGLCLSVLVKSLRGLARRKGLTAGRSGT
jgi:hypothetical protein